MLRIEAENDSAMFVFLSDVWLDKPEVTLRLKRLFLGYSAMPPTAFVFMGNFMASTADSGPIKIKKMKELFKNLGDIILEHGDLAENSKFIFVPGPNDPGFANIFPRPAMPEFIHQELTSKLPNAIFATNPCRIQYCSQEMVIFR
jgi:DNA polymerase epsilon subunit 2